MDFSIFLPKKIQPIKIIAIRAPVIFYLIFCFCMFENKDRYGHVLVAKKIIALVS